MGRAFGGMVVSSAIISMTSITGRVTAAGHELPRAGLMCKDQLVPLPRWQPRLARERRADRLRRRPMLAWVGFGLAMLGLSATRDRHAGPTPWLAWNASGSAPIGLWRIHPGMGVAVGDMAMVRTPDGVRQFAAGRHYVPAGVPLLKRVAAADGAHICAVGRDILIDGHRVAVRRAVDQERRPLPWWTGCRRLSRGQLFLLNRAPDSFDSRYFGPVEREAVIGRAVSLWSR